MAMKDTRRLGWALAGLLLVTTIASCSSTGQQRFFGNQAYHFQTLRALNDASANGAEVGEVLQIIRQIKEGDGQSWYSAWDATGRRILESAKHTQDPTSRGHAFLRAHNYLRTAEFFLSPNDPRRLDSFHANVAAFESGLDALGVQRERLKLPYGQGELQAIYYPGPPGAERKPLLMFCGGIDSTLEELYFVLVRAAHDRGFAVLTYEGPGQGAALREHAMTFTPAWERPTGAVLDAFIATHPKPARLVLLGMSMGGMLAPRAAAFDGRIDGVVAFDVMNDLGVIGEREVPALARWLHSHGIDAPIDAFIRARKALSPALRWAVDNSQWVMGTTSPMQTLDAMRNYTLRGLAQRISGDVLMLAGERDHFVPLSQLDDFRAGLTQARSVTAVVYDEASGAAEHCQMGAMARWHADLFDWLLARFPDSV
jgi:alpha-beta hydrolase superfamily lysophospholipase